MNIQNNRHNDDINKWLDRLANKPEAKDTAPQNKRAIYTLKPLQNNPYNNDAAFLVNSISTSILKNGFFGKTQKHISKSTVSHSYSVPDYVTPTDVMLIKLMDSLNNQYYTSSEGCYIPAGEGSILLLDMLLDTKKCYLLGETIPEHYLRRGEQKHGSIRWKVDPEGNQTAYAEIDDMREPLILMLDPIYYICQESYTIGILDLGMDSKKAAILLKAPSIKPTQTQFVKQKLSSLLPSDIANDSTILPKELTIRNDDTPPQPRLTLKGLTIQPQRKSYWEHVSVGKEATIGAAELYFNYPGKNFAHDDKSKEFTRFKGGEVLLTKRNFIAENEAMQLLHNCGISLHLRSVEDYYKMKKADYSCITIGANNADFHKNKKLPAAWEDFIENKLPLLKEQGWIVKIDPSFPYNVVHIADADNFYTEIDEGGIDWFGLELGVIINEEKLNLIPILLDFMKKDKDIFNTVKNLPKKGTFSIFLQDGRQLAMPVERAKLLFETLKNIFSFHNIDSKGDKLKLSKMDAVLLAEMEAASKALNMRWVGGEKLRTLGQNLKDFTSIAKILPPKTFHGELRLYQQEGVNWLQFLRKYGLAGILADDMGLGKTVQILAHIALEKSSNRLNKPFLVIAPTSVVVNWRIEAERFVPDLKILTLHGTSRKKHYDHINDYDLVLTTYPLLARDKEILLKLEYHTIVLDEAQTIKNSRAQITQVANQLKASNRICLTGTPMENHLGELWSLFNFLLPGYLGTAKEFTQYFRNNIEKGGSSAHSEALMKRIKPFILRRTKQEVTQELPPKTEIMHMIELDGAQRDLYEAIRVSMHSKIQKEIAAHGVEKSHIILLDALLKLRQVCCDPSLLKLDAAKDVTESAKLTELMNMIVPMIEEGRKILLFSQFTSMLALIVQKLKAHKIDYVTITGETKDRETPVRQFQEGKVPLFLISLKAGGTGLNLTAADTVIHYDPWWNPAVENQATDRAYRIGQDKPVFVYKLITSQTVEEKIIEMQNRKRKLMDSLFDASAKASSKLTAEDIMVLFEPNVPV